MTDGCMPSCWLETECEVCHHRQKPRGRSVGLEAANSYCGEECGTFTDRHLWSEHDEVRGITDPEGWAEHFAACEQCNPTGSGEEDDD